MTTPTTFFRRVADGSDAPDHLIVPPHHITITHDGYDYRVPGPDGREETAYYTDDRDDACDTARVMYPDNDLNIRWKRLED
jgi:hypothetical protein